MFSLILDTSTEKGIIVISEGSRVICELPLLLKAIKGSSLLISSINQVFSQAKISGSDLKTVGVGIGPGSFTGIRVAVSFAKGLATALRIPLISFSSLAGLVMKDEGPFFSAIPTNRGGFYVLSRISRKGNIEDLSEPQFIASISSSHKVISSADHGPSASYLAQIVEDKFLRQQFSKDREEKICYITPFSESQGVLQK